jgi:hypothetical protein
VIEGNSLLRHDDVGALFIDKRHLFGNGPSRIRENATATEVSVQGSDYLALATHPWG